MFLVRFSNGRGSSMSVLYLVPMASTIQLLVAISQKLTTELSRVTSC